MMRVVPQCGTAHSNCGGLISLTWLAIGSAIEFLSLIRLLHWYAMFDSPSRRYNSGLCRILPSMI